MAGPVMRRVVLFCMACLLAIGMAGCATAPSAQLSHLSDLTALQQRADQAYAKHAWADAAVDYGALVKRVPDNAAYWFRLGNCYARLDQPMPAVAAYRAALQRDPHIAPAWHNLGAVLLEQSQAAFGEAAANAKPADPLRRSSSLLAERIGAIRKGSSRTLPAKPAPAAQVPAAASSQANPPATSSGAGGGR